MVRSTVVLADAYRIEKGLEVGRRPIYECFAGFDIDYVIDFESRDALAEWELWPISEQVIGGHAEWHAWASLLRRCSSKGSNECALTHI